MLTVGHISRDGKCPLLIKTHADETLVPTTNDLAHADCWDGTDTVLTTFDE